MSGRWTPPLPPEASGNASGVGWVSVQDNGKLWRYGFALAGAGELLAHGIVNRPTRDVDLFTPEEAGPGAVAEQVVGALREVNPIGRWTHGRQFDSAWGRSSLGGSSGIAYDVRA